MAPAERRSAMFKALQPWSGDRQRVVESVFYFGRQLHAVLRELREVELLSYWGAPEDRDLLVSVASPASPLAQWVAGVLVGELRPADRRYLRAAARNDVSRWEAWHGLRFAGQETELRAERNARRTSDPYLDELLFQLQFAQKPFTEANVQDLMERVQLASGRRDKSDLSNPYRSEAGDRALVYLKWPEAIWAMTLQEVQGNWTLRGFRRTGWPMDRFAGPGRY